MDLRHANEHNQGATAADAAGRGTALLLALPLAAGLLCAGQGPARAAVSNPVALAASALSDSELSGLRGGFAFGGFDLSVGIVARSIIDQALGSASGAGGLGERLEVVTRFTVPAAGRIAHAGTTVQTLSDAAGGGISTTNPLPGMGVAVSTTGTTTTVDIGGTTRLAQHMLNTFVQNADVNRVITNTLDINLEVGGVARQLGALRAARAMRPAIDAQILYGPR